MIISFFSGFDFAFTATLILAEFQYAMKHAWIVFLSIGRTLWTAGGYDSGMNFQLVNISEKAQLQRYIPAPSAYNACACSIARNCPDPAWSGAQFLCHYGDNCTKDTVVWSMPGLVKACTSLDSVLSSDLRCFYDKTCLDIFLTMYNVDTSKRQPLSSVTFNISALINLPSPSFQPTDSLEVIFRGLMIDDWKMSHHYDSYYNACAPATCTYTISGRLGLFYIFTIIPTFLGSLAVTFRLFIPICVRFIYWIMTYRHNRRSNTNDQRSTNLPSSKYFLL